MRAPVVNNPACNTMQNTSFQTTKERMKGLVCGMLARHYGSLAYITFLDLQHNLYLLTLDYKLGLAPPNKEGSGVKRVLDIGTGTGLWAIEFADEHPEAEVG